MEMAKYNVLDIARYVINYSWEIGAPISNLKLQKLLYLIQANFICNKGMPCFKENIEAWSYGPVVPEVYSEFRSYGSNYINKINKYSEFEKNKFVIVEKKFTFVPNTDDLKIIQGVVDSCKNYSAGYLVELTHKQEPWKKNYEPYTNHIISLADIKEYFCRG